MQRSRSCEANENSREERETSLKKQSNKQKTKGNWPVNKIQGVSEMGSKEYLKYAKSCHEMYVGTQHPSTQASAQRDEPQDETKQAS